MSDKPEPQDSLPISAALCIDSDAFERLGRVVRALTVGLIDESVRIRVLSSDPRLGSLSLGPVQTIAHQPIDWPRMQRRLRKVIESVAPQPPTVVHALSAGSYQLALALAAEFDADCILQVTSLEDCQEVAQLDDRQIHALIVMSDPLVQVLREQVNVRAETIHLIRPGVLAAPRAACFGRPDYTTTILCTSAFDKISGVDRLIEALALLTQRNHEVLAFLMGRGRREAALRRLVHERGVARQVTFALPLGEPAEAMKSADIFVRPSADTMFFADPLLAMAAGMAVVALPSSICDFLRDGETAMLAPTSSAESLADTIERLIVDYDFARRIAATGVEYVRTHHAMSGMVERTAAVYRKLALTRATFRLKEPPSGGNVPLSSP